MNFTQPHWSSILKLLVTSRLPGELVRKQISASLPQRCHISGSGDGSEAALPPVLSGDSDRVPSSALGNPLAGGHKEVGGSVTLFSGNRALWGLFYRTDNLWLKVRITWSICSVFYYETFKTPRKHGKLYRKHPYYMHCLGSTVNILLNMCCHISIHPPIHPSVHLSTHPSDFYRCISSRVAGRSSFHP